MDTKKNIIVIIGTLDTKGKEIKYLKEKIEEKGIKTILVDCGVLRQPDIKADISRDDIAKFGGKNLEDLQKSAEEGADSSLALNVMIKGVQKAINDLLESKKIDGIVSIGGPQGTRIGITIMKTLPVGFPKLMVTSLMGQSVGTKDIAVFQTPDAQMGLNPEMKRALSQAAGIICGMVEAEISISTQPLPLIGITALGVTSPAVRKIVSLLNEKGYDPVVFHGRTELLNELIGEDEINGLIDLTPFEIYLMWERRLKSAYQKNIPQIIIPGGLDMLIFPGTKEILPEKYKMRQIHSHTSNIVLVRTSKEEIERAAKIIVDNANKAKGPIAIMIPSLGFSEVDKEGKNFFEPETDKKLIQILKSDLDKEIKFIEINSHINDLEFAEKVVNVFQDLYKQ